MWSVNIIIMGGVAVGQVKLMKKVKERKGMKGSEGSEGFFNMTRFKVCLGVRLKMMTH